jgi:hypothetical protein
MNCQYRNISYPICGLGLYKGMPSIGMCNLCIEKEENTIKHAQTVLDKKNINIRLTNQVEAQVETQVEAQVKSLAKAITKWGSSGFQITDPSVFNQRMTTCKGCEFWDSEALNGTGRCKKCGCSTWAKLRMATEKCPIGKW